MFILRCPKTVLNYTSYTLLFNEMALEMEQKLMEEPNPIGEEEQVNDKLPGTAIQIESGE